MPVCFTNPEEKKKFDANVRVFGERESLRDLVNYDRVRSLEEINDTKFDKLFNIPNAVESDVKKSFLDYNTQDILKEVESYIRRQNQIDSYEFAVDMSKRLDIEYEIVSLDEAKTIANRTKFHGGGFYKGGKVYLIQGLFSSDTVFHEFAHPIVKALAKENPELFQKLYSEIPVDFVSDIVSQYEKEYGENPEEIKQEVV